MSDPLAFDRLVNDHYGPALHYAQRLVRDGAEAEDCVQEAFAEALTGLHTLRDSGAVAGWIRGIVRHRCLRRLRRRDLELVPFASEMDELAHDSDSGEEDEARRQRRELASRLVAALPRHERDIVTLFYSKECSQREIAAFLGIPLSTVNNRLYEARQRMKGWEDIMTTNVHDVLESEGDRVSRVGTLVSSRGPLAEVRFDPGAPCDVFDAIAVVGPDGGAVERMKICHRFGDGRVQCLVTDSDAPPPIGTSVLNTGKVGIGLSPLRGLRGTSAESLTQVVQSLREAATPPRLLETGIKAIDLLCPLAAGGVAAQVGTAGVGRMVLLDELGAQLGPGPRKLTMLCLVDRTEPDPYRGWGEAVLLDRFGGVECCWALSDHATDPELSAIDACDAVIYLSPLLALRGLYPAIDPEYSRSRLLRPEVVGAEHQELAERVRRELIFAKHAEADPVVLELLACRARAAARRRIESTAPQVDEGSRLRLARAHKLRAFLSQPFAVATEVTGWAGVRVSLADTLQGCRAILDGEVDALPEAAFAYAGTLADVHEHARSSVRRNYG